MKKVILTAGLALLFGCVFAQQTASDYIVKTKNAKKTLVAVEQANEEATQEAEDVKALIASLYHEFNHSDWNHFCACKTISDGRKVGLTKEESLLFGKDNTEIVIRIRVLLDHIMELAEQRDDVIGWEGMLDGCFVMRLLFWCGWNGSKNEALLRYIKYKCNGKIDVVEMGTVMYHKRKVFRLDNEERYKQQNTFNAEIDAFVDAIMGNSSDATH